MKKTIETECTVLEALKALSPDSSTTSLRSWVEQGRVSLDGVRVTSARTTLVPGQNLLVGPKLLFTEKELVVLYEDSEITVIDKPAKLLTVATDFETGRTAHAILKRRNKGPVFPVHRLDRDTSGVMVFARSNKARHFLKELFADHTIQRQYYALLEGRLKEPKGSWKSTLVQDANYFVRSGREDDDRGKPAITHFEQLSCKNDYSLVRFELETGRKNQIRVHASEAGHPIAGDKKYGAKTNRFSRLCLHAHILGFTHPVSNKLMRFTSPLPPFFRPFI